MYCNGAKLVVWAAREVGGACGPHMHLGGEAKEEKSGFYA